MSMKDVIEKVVSDRDFLPYLKITLGTTVVYVAVLAGLAGAIVLFGEISFGTQVGLTLSAIGVAVWMAWRRL